MVFYGNMKIVNSNLKKWQAETKCKCGVLIEYGFKKQPTYLGGSTSVFPETRTAMYF